MKCATILCATLLAAIYASPSYSSDKTGVVIEDKESYPFYKFSQLINSDNSPSLLLKGSRPVNYSVIVGMLNNMGVPYQLVSEEPAIFQTDWVSWHYDAKSNKTLSHQKNRFFSMNTRDKYKFRLTVKNIQNNPEIMLDNVDREHEVDITSGTEMIWLKWIPIDHEPKAVVAFLQRIQTEYELYALASNKTISHKTSSNHLSVNMSVDQAWALIIKLINQKLVPLESTHNEQHMLNTAWLNAQYNSDTNSFNLLSKDLQRHKFQLLVVPGSTPNTSSIFAYHTAFQQNDGSSSWSDGGTQEAIAGAFLEFLEIVQ